MSCPLTHKNGVLEPEFLDLLGDLCAFMIFNCCMPMEFHTGLLKFKKAAQARLVWHAMTENGYCQISNFFSFKLCNSYTIVHHQHDESIESTKQWTLLRPDICRRAIKSTAIIKYQRKDDTYDTKSGMSVPTSDGLNWCEQCWVTWTCCVWRMTCDVWL